jgi:hypothetical protein
MSFEKTVLNGALSVIAEFHPEYKPYVDWFKAHEDEAIAIAEAVGAALAKGSTASAAIRHKSPELADAITEVAHAQSVLPSRRDNVNIENITRTCFGFPRLTQAEETAWMDNSTPPNDSRIGSG